MGGVGGQRHVPATIPPVKARYPLYRMLGGPQGRSGQVQKNFALTGIRSPDRPARSESLYRLSYRGPRTVFHMKLKFIVHCWLRPFLIIISESK